MEYIAVLHNHLEYHIKDNHTVNLSFQSQRVMNASARLVYCAPKYCHVTPLLRELHWLPVRLRVDFKILLVTFKILHGVAPSYLKDLVSVLPDSRYQLRRNNNGIECFHSRGQHICKFMVTKESVCIRKGINSQRTCLGHQHGLHFIVLGHQYGRRDVM